MKGRQGRWLKHAKPVNRWPSKDNSYPEAFDRPFPWIPEHYRRQKIQLRALVGDCTQAAADSVSRRAKVKRMDVTIKSQFVTIERLHVIEFVLICASR